MYQFMSTKLSFCVLEKLLKKSTWGKIFYFRIHTNYLDEIREINVYEIREINV